MACSSGPPKNLNSSCDIFHDKRGWYQDAVDSYEKWGVPVQVQLAIIYQESRFVDDAKPPRRKILWIIPWRRQSSAYGYGQVMDTTWDWYKKSTENRWADRDDFEDVVDFIGWYGSMSYSELGISKWDAHNQYLAYHEGHNGYKRKTYLKKPWLIKVAKKVDDRAKAYHTQLNRCKEDLKKSGWFL